MSLSFALVGNPNVGKTSLYNRLTRSTRHVGNWHGVTVDKAAKKAEYNGETVNIIDLPGLYSLTVYSSEEAVSRDEIMENKSDLIINVCDASNLARNLYLCLQIMELGRPVALAVNMMDELNKRGMDIDSDLLSGRLHIPVVTLSARYKLKTDTVLDPIRKYAKVVSYPELPYLKNLPLNKVRALLGENIKRCKLRESYVCIKVLERDEFILNTLQLSDSQKKAIDALGDFQTEVATQRYKYIETLLDGIYVKQKNMKTGARLSDKADKIILNKFLAIPIFILIMSGIFWITFGFIGGFFTDMLENGKDALAFAVYNGLSSTELPVWLNSLIAYGIIDSVGGVAVFLPQIIILFFFLAILEDSGYISRLAFMTDGMFGKIGLSGRAVFTMIMGLGCSATAVMTARGLEDEMMRKKTVVLTPFMSCSARLPVYTAIAGAFFTSGNVLIILGLYLLGAIVVIFSAALMQKSALKSGPASFIMEMPKYRLPTAERVLQIIGNNIKTFVVKVGSTVLMLSVVVWILSNFSIQSGFVQAGEGKSIMESFCTLIAPIFKPLGFGNWQAVTALISGLAAKEVVITTITSLGGVQSVFPDTLAAVCFMVYTLLYVPCAATLGAIKKEAGGKWMLFGLTMQLSVAYIVTFLIRIIVLSFDNGIFAGIISVAFCLALFISIYFAFDIFSKRRCVRCSGECLNCQ